MKIKTKLHGGTIGETKTPGGGGRGCG